MVKRILKYTLAIEDMQVISLPQGAEILSVANQRGDLMLWAMVSVPTVDYHERRFEIVGTGNPIDELPLGTSRKFIGTVVIEPFVWHVFELVPSRAV